MALQTPVLLIAWRRPDTLRQVIDAIRSVALYNLFVACDGPSPERQGEAEKVAATRQVIEQEIDWPCQMKKLYADINQGCKLGVSSAIGWFFQHVEEGIILEDDGVPYPDFTPLLCHPARTVSIQYLGLVHQRQQFSEWPLAGRRQLLLQPIQSLLGLG